MTVSATPTSSTATPPADAAAASPADERTLVRAVLAMGVGGFAIGTGEFVIMGLLPEVALDLGVSIPQAGHVISAYALGVVVGAPVLAVAAAARWAPMQPLPTVATSLPALVAIPLSASRARPLPQRRTVKENKHAATCSPQVP